MPHDEPLDLTERLLQAAARDGWEAAAAHHRAELAAAIDPQAESLRHLVAGWLAVENTQVEEARACFRGVHASPRLAPWAYLGEALVAVRIKDFAAAATLLDQAEAAAANSTDSSPAAADLPALIAHARGSRAAHEGHRAEAKRQLYRAVELLPATHFAYGRLLDTLGTHYVNDDHFLIGRLLLERALACKARVGDRRGLALTHGQIGRLYRDWGYLSHAEHHFHEDLRLAKELGDRFGEARMLGALGEIDVLIAFEARFRKHHDRAREFADRAAGWLAEALAQSRAGGFDIGEAFARKDLAKLALFRGQLDTAEREAAAARAVFTAKRFEEGEVVVDRVVGLIHEARGDWPAAREKLTAALAYYTRTGDRTEAARLKLDLAQVAIRSGEPEAIVERSVREALVAAESSRRTSLIEEVEAELKQTLPAVYWAHLYQRVRGRMVTSGATALVEGVRETGTVIYFDLQGSTDFCHGRDPEEVMLTINQMMHDTAVVLRRHDAQSVGSRGDGFLALSRGRDHAARAVAAGLELITVMEEFNEPRRVLGIPTFNCRVGISTGEVLFGNVGSYDKLDFSGVGTMMNLGARVESKALTGMPCISDNTYRLVKDRFRFTPESPRTIEAKGLGEQLVWDVVARIASD